MLSHHASPAAKAARGKFREVEVVHDFFGHALERVYAAAQSNAAGVVEPELYPELLHRVLAWLRTLVALRGPSDFQAASVSARAIFEICVDVVLLSRDPGNPPAKLLAWEESTKFHAAERIVKYFAKLGVPVPAEFAMQDRHVARKRKDIEALRLLHWPTKPKDGKPPVGTHPSHRWTNAPSGLADDAAIADRHAPQGEFRLFTATRYPLLCWHTHGSGLAGIREINAVTFPALIAVAFDDTIRYSLIALEVVMRHLGLWGAEAEAEFRELKERRILEIAAVHEAHDREVEASLGRLQIGDHPAGKGGASWPGNRTRCGYQRGVSARLRWPFCW